MDLLYSRYSNPMELVRIYIENGRFGEFVSEIINMEKKRRNEEAEKENDSKLWLAYVLSASDIHFNDWKKGLYQKKEKEPGSYTMTDAQVESAKQSARGILKRFSPK